jgi:hypothetical protein
MFDYNDAQEQKNLDVIPENTVAVVQLTVRPGNAGENGILKRSKNGAAEGLDAVFTVVEGPYTKRRFFAFMILSGSTDGHMTAADITRSKLRAILESARGIKPADVSEEAKKARVAELEDFNGMRFMCRIGVEPEKDGYKAKNILGEVITPDKKEWHQVEQIEVPAPSSAPAESANAIARPAWAQ